MIDLHAHILPGLDDGAQRLEESIEMARMAEENGVTDLVATPHSNQRGRFENDDPAQLRVELNQLRAVLKAEGIPLHVHLGMEILASSDWKERVEQGERRPHHGDGIDGGDGALFESRHGIQSFRGAAGASGPRSGYDTIIILYRSGDALSRDEGLQKITVSLRFDGRGDGRGGEGAKRTGPPRAFALGGLLIVSCVSHFIRLHTSSV